MADIAGSAVGIVSLGIQVCQGLLQYYGDWKGYHKDIEASHKAVQGLTETFVLLAQVLNGNVVVNDAQRRNVENCVASCEDSVGHLRDRLAELRKYGHPAAFREKVKASGSRLLYPFKKESLDVLRNLVQEILQRLMLAVNVLNADVGLEMRAAVLSMQTDLSSLGQSSADILKAVRDLADKLNCAAGYMVGFRQSFDLLTTRTGQTAFDIMQLLTLEEARHRHEVLNWLAAPDPAMNHLAARKHHQPGTCQWFLTSQQYTGWTQGQSRHIWLHGKAGCCKTVLSSTIVEDLSSDLPQQPGVALAYFYFSFAEPQKQSYRNMLLSIVSQLSRERKLLPELAAAHASNQVSSERDLENMISALAKDLQRVLIVIDALDEVPECSSERQDVLDGLQMLSTRSLNIGLLMTSRPDAGIEVFMREWHVVALPIDEEAVNADIDLYVTARLSQDRRFRGKEWSTKVRQEVLDTFQQKAQGMFRWAACQLENLAAIKICTPKYIRARLTALPKTLPATYERMLSAIEDEYIEAARHALVWLAFAEQELTLQELEDTYIIQPGITPAVDEENRAPAGSIIRVLKSLVVVTAQVEHNKRLTMNSLDEASETSSTTSNVELTGSRSLRMDGQEEEEEDDDDDDDEDKLAQCNNAKVRLAHYSVKEYLMSNLIRCSPTSSFALSATEGHMHIVQCCFAYLAYHEDLMWQACADKNCWHYGALRPLDTARTSLLHYIAFFWQRHAHLVEQTDGSNANNVARFLRTHRKLLPMVKAIAGVRGNGMYGLPAVLPLEIAISSMHEQLPHTLRALCEAGENVNARPGFGRRFLLSEAVCQRDVSMVSTLIEFGADVNAFEEDSSPAFEATPLSLACSEAYYNRDVVELLIENGADVNAFVEGGLHVANATPLSAALHKAMSLFLNHDMTTMQTLLSVKMIAENRHFRTIDDRVDAVDILLRNGADVRNQAGADGSLLVTAVRYDDGRLTTRLLQGGAPVNSKGHTFYPLEEAVRYCNHAAAKSLLEAGGDPAHGWKALLELFHDGFDRPELCQRVTQARVDRILEWGLILLAANSTPDPTLASEALASYTWTGYPELVSFILPFVTEVNCCDGRAGTALYEAERELKWRSDISEPDYDPIDEGRRFGKIVDLLREKGAISLPPIDSGRFEDYIDDSFRICTLSQVMGRLPRHWGSHHVLCPACDEEMMGQRFKCLDCAFVEYCRSCFGDFKHEASHDWVAVSHPLQLRHAIVTAKRILRDLEIRGRPLLRDREGVVFMEVGSRIDSCSRTTSHSNDEAGSVDSDSQNSGSDSQDPESDSQDTDSDAGAERVDSNSQHLGTDTERINK
ncbi:hypothetical protein LTR27_008643 [Elasticomyces elasticus]|nr:hypothetical protein LTR27_008643 [Elasticomyces elasticus]